MSSLNSVKAGMKIITQEKGIPSTQLIMANQAEVFGEPDFYNKHQTKVYADGSRLKAMKSFVCAYVDTLKYTSAIMAAYLEYYERFK